MSHPATLSNEAHFALVKAKREPRESLSDVILRHVPRPIETFGDLEAHLASSDAPLAVDFEALNRLRERKAKANDAD